MQTKSRQERDGKSYYIFLRRNTYATSTSRYSTQIKIQSIGGRPPGRLFSWPGLRPRRKWRFLCSFSLPPSLPCRPSLWLWALAWVFGASSISWRATAPTTPAPMLMCGKVTNKNLIGRPTAIPNFIIQKKQDKHNRLLCFFCILS